MSLAGSRDRVHPLAGISQKEGKPLKRPIAAAGWPRALFYLLQFSWGLPVNLVGLLLFSCCRGARRERFHNSIVSRLPGNSGGLCIGIFIFLRQEDPAARRRTLVHEYGHTIQCLLLGPLYWPLIVLPSAIWYHGFKRWRQKHRVPYDALFCERWATRWGKIWSGDGS